MTVGDDGVSSGSCSVGGGGRGSVGGGGGGGGSGGGRSRQDSACMIYNGCVIEIVSLLCRQKSSAAS